MYKLSLLSPSCVEPTITYATFAFSFGHNRAECLFMLRGNGNGCIVSLFWLCLTLGFSLARFGNLGGDEWRMKVSKTYRHTLSCSLLSICARNAVKQKPARRTVINPMAPAAENNPFRITRQLNLGVAHLLRWPHSTKIPTNSNTSPTAKPVLSMEEANEMFHIDSYLSNILYTLMSK